MAIIPVRRARSRIAAILFPIALVGLTILGAARVYRPNVVVKADSGVVRGLADSLLGKVQGLESDKRRLTDDNFRINADADSLLAYALFLRDSLLAVIDSARSLNKGLAAALKEERAQLAYAREDLRILEERSLPNPSRSWEIWSVTKLLNETNRAITVQVEAYRDTFALTLGPNSGRILSQLGKSIIVSFAGTTRMQRFELCKLAVFDRKPDDGDRERAPSATFVVQSDSVALVCS